MQNDVGKITGVSPAYFVSLFGTSFTPENVKGEIEALKGMGFSTLQYEVFEEPLFENWKTDGLAAVMDETFANGLKPSAFVAHFLGGCFTSKEKLETEAASGNGLIKDVLEMLLPLGSEVPLAVPMMPCLERFSGDEMLAAEVLCNWAGLVDSYGRSLVLEIVPGSIAGGYTNFLTDSVWKSAAEKIGFLLDTGHANICGEDFVVLVEQMGSKLKVLHLSDNDGKVNLSLPPGEGNVNWTGFFEALDKTGYSGSLDLEIVCDKNAVREKYKAAREHLDGFFACITAEEGVASWIW
ncbi:MAG: sugar phosphate isomerase/epimerase [Spirochaetales bacterium]|nr:sugar phosphate isomerase/epimerase [Spirochaetales bacterium]